MSQPRVAIVGGGITGAAAAAELSKSGLISVTVFDQGRRGPGGRASHRRVAKDGHAVLADDAALAGDDASTFEFDHGCQFLRADDAAMQELVADWCAQGWAAPWEGRFGCLKGSGAAAGETTGDFFGLPGSPAPVYTGVGGMHRLPRAILAGCKEGTTSVQRGVRVAGLVQNVEGWTLLGTEGAAAFHDTPEAQAAGVEPSALAEPFDAVLMTDVSSSFGGWHRAGAGLPEEFAARVRDRVRVPLFSCMVAFEAPLTLPLDGVTVDGDAALWFAARSQSKAGMPTGAAECWTLVSTPGFAVAEITETPMQDASGAFVPQSDDYLNTVPGPALLAAFAAAVAPSRGGAELPRAVYLQGQRWGSAMPAPAGVGGRDTLGRGDTTSQVLGGEYESAVPPLLFEAPAGSDEFVADDGRRLYYAGDYCSRRNPGFEAAALSGLAAAQHIRAVVLGSRPRS